MIVIGMVSGYHLLEFHVIKYGWLNLIMIAQKSFIINHDEGEQMRSERKKTNMSDVSWLI